MNEPLASPPQSDAADVWAEVPILPLTNTIVWPETAQPLPLRSALARHAADAALGNGGRALALALRQADPTLPPADNLYRVGTEIALSPLPALHNGPSVLAQGLRRLELVEIVRTEPYLVGRVRALPDTGETTPEMQATMRAAVNLFRQAVALNEDLTTEILDVAHATGDPGALADLVASTLKLTPDERQSVLEATDKGQRLRIAVSLLGKELALLQLEREIEVQAQQEIERGQRELFLREQMRVIQHALGEDDVPAREIDALRERIEAASLPLEVYTKACRELARLNAMPPLAPEASMVHTYLDWLASLPWANATDDNLDLANAKRVLDDDHHGLPRVKDRVLEHIAVRKLAARKMQTPILCFVGPPGTGKTSMGKSIARALGRTFARVSLGGVHDEAEIRGHRRTYVGALPGRIVQAMRRVGTVNPVLMLDEIDKLGNDARGDPASALLEVLDPEQNATFVDHYLDVPYDLSQVLFITTANELYPLPPALEDRLEVIEFPGYLEDEKLAIAQAFLLPRQLDAHGLAAGLVTFGSPALTRLIRDYTYEAGVRNLDRRIAEVLRKVARQIVEGKPATPRRVTAGQLEKLLGPPDQFPHRANDRDAVGLVNGLAYTSGGGDILTIEVSVLPGKGTLLMTGQLGDVMQESAQAALSYMRARAEDFDVPFEDFENNDIHIHLPEGGVPKDGPSAGVALATAIVSAFTERPVRANVAMTGEITLRGRLLPVGGVREKIVAAHRARIKQVLLPAQNRPDLADVPKNALRGMEVTLVDDLQQVLDAVLLAAPAQRTRDARQPTPDAPEADAEVDTEVDTEEEA